MTVSDSRQQPLFDVESFLDDSAYEVGSFYWMIQHVSELIMLREDFPPADERLGGERPWCPVLKSKLVLIQRKEGWSDRRTIEAAKTDLRVKKALGLGVEAQPPGQATLSRHRQEMEDRGLDEIYMHRFQRLLEALELLRLDEPVCIDTVPVAGAGQVKDTYNLLGDGIRKGLSALAGRTELDAEDVARRLGFETYLTRSPKGSAEIDWSQPEQRRACLARLVEDARHIRDLLEGGWEPDPDGDGPGGGRRGAPQTSATEASSEETADSKTQQASETLGRILDHDIAYDDQGRVEGLRDNPGGGRLISTTDPEMVHGRKSASKVIAGFKAHIVATAAAGWILLTKIIQANRHDGKDLPDLLERARCRKLEPRVWIGDHAYGTLDNHVHVARLDADQARGDVELVARNARPPNGGRYRKVKFRIDWSARELTCPAGEIAEMRYAKQRGDIGWEFSFRGEQCADCPLRSECVSAQAKPTTGRTVFMVPEREKVLRKHLQRREEEEFREFQRQRWRVEQANAGFAQCGGKQADRFGLDHVGFDARLSAIAYNLRKLGGNARDDARLRDHLGKLEVRQTGASSPFFVSAARRTFSPRRRAAGRQSDRRTRRSMPVVSSDGYSSPITEIQRAS